MSEPIREMLKVRINPEAVPTSMVKMLHANVMGFPKETGIFHPEGTMSLEDFPAGETVYATFWYAEFHQILKGSAEISYSLAPWHDEERKMSVETGDAYLIPTGAQVTWKVTPGGPLRHVCIAMPRRTEYEGFPPNPENVIKL